VGTHAATRERSATPFTGRLAVTALVVGIVAVQFAIAFAAAGRPANAVQILAGIVLVVSAVAYPRMVLAVALVATMFPQRVGPAALNMSVTDAVGVLAIIAALRFVPWTDRRLRLVLGGLAIYLGTLAVSLVVHHDQRAVFEWAHRGVLYIGTIFIGIAIVRSGTTKWALRIFMVAMSALALASCLDALRTGLEPAEAFQLNKNHAGLLLAAAFLVAYAAGRQLAWTNRTLLVLRVLLLLGLAATQSRAAALGLVAALAMRPLLLGRRGNQRAASIGILVVCVGLLTVSAISLNTRDLERSESAQKFNAINTRTDVIKQALDEVWGKNRFVGGGLRYFVNPARPYATPHNLIVGEMAESGIIGLLGLAALLIATVMALRRSSAPLAVLGAMAFVLRVTQGMADIFWVAGPLTVALILVGMGLTEEPGTEAQPPNGARRWAHAAPRLGSSRGLM
jgi:hypothetical protein